MGVFEAIVPYQVCTEILHKCSYTLEHSHTAAVCEDKWSTLFTLLLSFLITQRLCDLLCLCQTWKTNAGSDDYRMNHVSVRNTTFVTIGCAYSGSIWHDEKVNPSKGKAWESHFVKSWY